MTCAYKIKNLGCASCAAHMRLSATPAWSNRTGVPLPAS